MPPRFIAALHLSVMLLAVGAIGRSSDFQTGTVVASDRATFDRNGIPCVATLPNGDLMTVWTASAKGSQTGHLYFAISADAGDTWSRPRLLLEDAERKDGDPNMIIDEKRVFVYSTRVSIPNTIAHSSIIAVFSEDLGATWSTPQEISIAHRYVVGKQHKGLKLGNGTFLMGIAWDNWPERGLVAKSESEMDLSAGVLLSRDALDWTLHGNLHANVQKTTPGATNGLCEPAVVELDDGELLMILRSGSSRHYESRSRDHGITWSAPEPSALTGHNTPTSLWRLKQDPSAIVAAWNNSPTNRYPLSVAVSTDGGRSWSPSRIVADRNEVPAAGAAVPTPDKAGQVSYPSLTQTKDGRIFLVWQSFLSTGGRDIRWARFSRAWITGDSIK